MYSCAHHQMTTITTTTTTTTTVLRPSDDHKFWINPHPHTVDKIHVFNIVHITQTRIFGKSQTKFVITT